MATALGGRITSILLWPFGGICFITGPPGKGRGRLCRDLAVTLAGPAMHVPMVIGWIGVLVALARAWQVEMSMPPWYAFQNPTLQATEPLSEGQEFVLHLAVQAVATNYSLFLFNVLFPMYPMDSSKILVGTMQLTGCASPRAAAWTLVVLSFGAAAYLVFSVVAARVGARALMSAAPRVNESIAVFMAVLCAVETHRIYELLKEDQIHRHPLFRGMEEDESEFEAIQNRDGADGKYRTCWCCSSA